MPATTSTSSAAARAHTFTSRHARARSNSANTGRPPKHNGSKNRRNNRGRQARRGHHVSGRQETPAAGSRVSRSATVGVRRMRNEAAAPAPHMTYPSPVAASDYNVEEEANALADAIAAATSDWSWAALGTPDAPSASAASMTWTPHPQQSHTAYGTESLASTRGSKDSAVSSSLPVQAPTAAPASPRGSWASVGAATFVSTASRTHATMTAPEAAVSTASPFVPQARTHDWRAMNGAMNGAMKVAQVAQAAYNQAQQAWWGMQHQHQRATVHTPHTYPLHPSQSLPQPPLHNGTQYWDPTMAPPGLPQPAAAMAGSYSPPSMPMPAPMAFSSPSASVHPGLVLTKSLLKPVLD